MLYHNEGPMKYAHALDDHGICSLFLIYKTLKIVCMPLVSPQLLDTFKNDVLDLKHLQLVPTWLLLPKLQDCHPVHHPGLPLETICLRM